jgi:hypothetical protein
MELRFKPETESLLNELAQQSGRAPEDLVEDALSGYFAEASELRATLDRRYQEIRSGRVKPIDGETFFESLRTRELDSAKNRSSE